jgi:hypothetical protein
VKSVLIRDPQLFASASEAASAKSQDPGPTVPNPRPVNEQSDVNQLINKYVAQEYIVGKQLDSRFKSTVQTLIRLNKPSEGPGPAQKFSTVAELIVNSFQYDKVIELLARSTSAFSKSQGSMAEWLTFLHNAVAGLLADSASVYIEATVTDIQEISRLKDILVDKVRRAKEQIKMMDKESSGIKHELKKLRENKEQLVARLHETDLKLIGRLRVIKEMEDELNETRGLLKKKSEEVAEIYEEKNKWREEVCVEVDKLKRELENTTVQKNELIAAIGDLRSIFKSFGLKL